MQVLRLPPLLILALPLAGCVLPGDEDDSGHNGDSTGTEPTTSATGGESSTDPTAPTSGTEPTTASGSEDSTGVDPDDTGSDTEDPTPAACSTASVLIGSPYFAGDLDGWNPAGQGLREEPPLRSRHVASTGDRIAIDTQFEIWGADDTQVFRIAGDEDEIEPQYQPHAACADVRLLVAAGIAALPDGRLVVADSRGNGVIELRDPFGTCTAAPIAGNPDATLDYDIVGGVAAPGDVDGPGIDARFDVVERPIADAEGNVYVLDRGNAAIKRIADDDVRTVSTVYDYGDVRPMGMTVMDGLLYVTGTTALEDFVWSIDPATGEQQEIYLGRGLFDEIDSTRQATLFAATNDGVDLLVASNRGYIFRLSTSAEPLGVIAGYGNIVDYPADLDLDSPIPLDQLPIVSYALGDADLVWHGDDLLFTNANAVGFHVWAIDCQ